MSKLTFNQQNILESPKVKEAIKYLRDAHRSGDDDDIYSASQNAWGICEDIYSGIPFESTRKKAQNRLHDLMCESAGVPK
jgi:hypothetical protein